MMSREVYPPALSKTAKYKKITKPLLERKRRARINRCLDELKDLMVGALEIDDDNISKLEKADILELTVNHLTKLHSPRDAAAEANRFQAGFNGCAAEACRYILTLPDLDAGVSQSLVHHLTRLTSTQPLSVQTFSPPTSPLNPANYNSDNDQYSPEVEDDLSPEIAGHYKSCESLSYQQEAPNYSEMSPYMNSAIHQDVSAPITGLLTTVDKIKKQPSPTQSHKIRPLKDDFHREPVINESKEEILQKIRQHIMERRNNDVRNSPEKHSPEKHNYNMGYNSVPMMTSKRNFDQETVTEPIYKYRNVYEERVETLDLTKKTREPSPEIFVQVLDKTSVSLPNTSKNLSQKRLITTNDVNDMTTEKQRQIDEMQNFTQKHELPMDYHNLPPKKKRKHLEFQMEMIRRQAQEKAALQNMADMSGDGPSVDQQVQQHEGDYQPSSWRPW